jgi:hypothetical protein
MQLFDLKQVDSQPQDPFGIWIEWTADDLATIHRWCSICKKPSEVRDCRKKSVDDWSLGTGAYMQDAFWEMDADERETIMSGTHGGCFDAIFPDEDE